MARRKRVEEHENHERWLVSYADFITLLFAFFVVMYSISSVNEGKYRVLSDSIVTAFRDPARSLAPVQIGTLVRSPAPSNSLISNNAPVIEMFSVPVPATPTEDRGRQEHQEPRESQTEEPLPDEGSGELDAASQALAASIEEAMADLVEDNLIQVRGDKRWIEVEINSSILYESGSAELSAQSIPVLRQLADKFVGIDNIIHVEGFTDDVPIRNFDFFSNWELSAARAASVVHLFTGMGIDPQRLAAIGYGEFRPIASNTTAEGRAKNRRVVLVIMSGKDGRVSQRMNHLQIHREGRPQWVEPQPASAAEPAASE